MEHNSAAAETGNVFECHLNKAYDHCEDEAEVTGHGEEKDFGHVNLSADDEERVLEKLREVVRKCTTQDPSKRPTAGELLQILDSLDIGGPLPSP